MVYMGNEAIYMSKKLHKLINVVLSYGLVVSYVFKFIVEPITLQIALLQAA